MSVKYFRVYLDAGYERYNTSYAVSEVYYKIGKNPDLARRAYYIVEKCKIVDRVVKLPRAALVYFYAESDLKQYVVKVFGSKKEYYREKYVLDKFGSNYALSKYIPNYDAEYFAGYLGVVYPKLVPVMDLLEKYDSGQVDKLMEWNRYMLKDVHDYGMRLCDHKCDNILFDPASDDFVLTDLEAVEREQDECRVITFNMPRVEWKDSFLFDYVHFVSSFYFVFGVNYAFERELGNLTESIMSHLPLSPTRDQLRPLIRDLVLLRVNISREDVARALNRSNYSLPLQMTQAVHAVMKYCPAANPAVVYELISRAESKIRQSVDQLPFFQALPLSEQKQLINNYTWVYAACLAIMCRANRVEAVDISYLVELLIRATEAARPHNLQTKKMIEGKGPVSRGDSALCEVFVAGLLLALFFCFVLRQKSNNESCVFVAKQSLASVQVAA